MKIAQLMTGSSGDFESRKRAIQRKEMGEAYKKTAQYQSPKNPMLEVLENLLSGKADKDLHAVDQAQRQLEGHTRDEVKAEQKPRVLKEQEEKLEQPEVKASEGSTSEETIKILGKVRAAALAPAEPSPQDLRVAASAATQIQQIRIEVSRDELTGTEEEDGNLFGNVDTSVDVPERFLGDFGERDASQQTLFGQELESLLFQRTFNKAVAKYTSHAAMVKNGYRMFNEPIFSRIA